MSKDKKAENSVKTKIVALNEDKGLSPVSSGTPMPKVKPAAKPSTSQEATFPTGKKES